MPLYASLIGFVGSMLPTLVDAAPAGADWLHEAQHDGYWTELALFFNHSRNSSEHRMTEGHRSCAC